MTPDPRYYMPVFPFLAMVGACWLRSATPVGRLRVVTFTLLKMADDNDRAARHAERKLIPFSDVTVTQTGYHE